MSRHLHLLIFFIVTLLVFGFVHFYLYKRLVILPAIPQPWAGILKISLIFLALTPSLSFLATRVTGTSLSRVLAVVGMVWMGVMFVLFIHTLIFDSIRASVWFAQKSALLAPWDTQRRLFLLRAGALAVGGLGALSSAWGIFRALGSLKTITVEIFIQGLDKKFDGYRIVQLSDVHLGPVLDKQWMKTIIKKSNQLQPDLVAITGDLVDGNVDQLREDVAPLKDLKTKDGTYFVTGNHEYYFDAPAWVEHLSSLEIKTLVNERVTLKRGKAMLDIAGVGDQTGLRMPSGGGTDIPKAMKGSPKNRPCVLLAHQPKSVEQASKYGIDLVLSGHTHGGQIWPFHYLVYLQQPYLKGLHNHKGTQIYVSQGSGTWGPPLRLGTQAELTQIILRAS